MINLKTIFKNENKLPATYNTELIAYLNKYNNKNDYIFTGVIMKDEIKNINVSEKMFMIINFDTTRQIGTHWVAVVKNGKNVNYFDSYGLIPLKEVQNKFKKYNLYYNDTAIQKNDSNICGQLCLAFIEHLINNKSYYNFIDIVDEYSIRLKDDLTPDTKPQRLNV